MKENKSPWLVLSLGFLFILLFSLALLLLQKPYGFIQGRIVDEKGLPVPNAKVNASAYPKYFKVVTDAMGNFRFDQIPVATYNMNVSAAGYQYFYFKTSVKVEEAKTQDLGETTLQETTPYFSAYANNMTVTMDESAFVSLSGTRIKEVQFELLKVDLVNYLKDGGNMSDLQTVTALSPQSNSHLSLVKSWGLTLEEQERMSVDKRVSLPIDEAGVYLLKASASSLDRTKSFSQNVLYSKTNLGYIAKRDANKLVIFSSSFQNPTPQENVKVYLFADGKLLNASATNNVTNAQGIYESDLSENVNNNDQALPLIVLQKDKDLAFAWSPEMYQNYDDEMDYSEGDETGLEASASAHTTLKGFVYTDRPLYRPGHKVYFKGLLREDQNNGSYSLPLVQNIEVSLQDPQGNFLKTLNLKSSSLGSFDGSFDLDEEADLGFYTLETHVNGKVFRKEFEVQEYRKPEFKVEVTAQQERYFGGDEISFLVSTQYYFGSPVPAELNYTLYKSANQYEEESYWDESDAYVGGYGDVVEEGSAKVDDKGFWNLKFKSETDALGARYTLRVSAKDITDREVTVEGDAQVVAGDFYFSPQWMEYFAVAGKSFDYRVRTYSYPEQAISKNFEIKIEKESFNKRNQEYEYKKINTLKLQSSAQGESLAQLQFPQGGHYRLSLSGKDSMDREVLYQDYVWVMGSSEVSEDYEAQKHLVLIPEKKKLEYEAGENLKVMVVSPVKDSQVWVTVESNKIQRSFVQKLQGNSGVLEIPLQKEWVPNIYVSASVIGNKQYYQETAEVAISPREHLLNLEVTPSVSAAHPGEIIKYKVKSSDVQGQGVAAEFSLGVVDESIYALKADNTDIKNFFWGPKPNQVNSNYSFSGYLSGGIEKEDKNLLRRNFKDTAFWLPTYSTDAQGNAEIEVQLPDNLTTWRTTVLAYDANTAVGQQKTELLSTKDLVTRIAAPRFFTERDEVVLKAVVQNFGKETQKLNVGLSLQGLNFINSDDAQNKNIELAPGKSFSLDFKVKANASGEAKLGLLAKNEKVSDGVELKIPILPHGIADLSYQKGVIAAKDENSLTPVQKINLALLAQSDASKSKVKLTLDTTLLGQILGPLNYLVEYPYGCVEQTSSKVLASLYAKQLLGVLGQQDAKLEKKVEVLLPRGLKRLIKMQSYDGSWGWWSGGQGDLFMTSYALFTLKQLQAAGIEVKETVLTNGAEALKKLIQSAESQSKSRSLMAFAYYVADLMHVKISKPMLPQTIQELSLKLLSEAQHKNSEVKVKELQQKIESSLKCNEKSSCLYDEIADGYWSYDKLGAVETSAWALKALMAAPHSVAQSAENDASAISQNLNTEKIAQALLSRMKGNAWSHTRATAITLSALLDYAKNLSQTVGGVKASLAFNSQSLESVNIANPHFVRNINAQNWNTGENLLEIGNLAEHSLYYQTELSQFSKEENLQSSNQGLELSREYFVLSKQSVNYTDASAVFDFKPLGQSIHKGEMLGVKLTLNSKTPQSYVIIEDALPAGFEVFDAMHFSENSYWADKTEIRDDKVALFISYLPEGKSVITYALRPELAGDFHVMPAQAYPMYNEEVKGLSSEQRIEVK